MLHVFTAGVMPDEKGSFDSGDPNTTNIYLGNINPKVSIEFVNITKSII